VLFVTFSLEQGLLLLANPLCLAIIKSCLARAQFKHPVTISAFVIEATHVHLILVVNNPEDIPGFIGYFKRESAHMLNRVLGRRKRTVWCEGYDSPDKVGKPKTDSSINELEILEFKTSNFSN